jgi:hypothetical protein
MLDKWKEKNKKHAREVVMVKYNLSESVYQYSSNTL